MAGIRGVTGWIGVDLACTCPPALARFYADLFGWEVSSSEPTYASCSTPTVILSGLYLGHN